MEAYAEGQRLGHLGEAALMRLSATNSANLGRHEYYLQNSIALTRYNG